MSASTTTNTPKVGSKRRREEPEALETQRSDDTKRQCRRPKTHELVQEVVDLMHELRGLGVKLTFDPALAPNAQDDIKSIQHALDLMTGEQIDTNEPFDGVSSALRAKLIRLQELFRTFIPPQIAMHGRVNVPNSAEMASEYRKMVMNIMDYYMMRIPLEKLREGKPEAVLDKRIRTRAHIKYRTIHVDGTHRVPKYYPYVSPQSAHDDN